MTNNVALPMDDDELVTIRLYGVLGRKFGRIHRLAVKSASEAIRALSVIVPGFKQYLVQSGNQGLTYAVFVGKANLDKEALPYPSGRADIRIAPVLHGKKAGLFQTILGVALIAASFMIPGSGLALGALTITQGAVFGMGAAMALGGIMQMLSPQMGGLASTADNGTSYYFNGPVNSSAQGEPVPIVYGEILAGSKVGSSGIYAEEQK